MLCNGSGDEAPGNFLRPPESKREIRVPENCINSFFTPFPSSFYFLYPFSIPSRPSGFLLLFRVPAFSFSLIFCVSVFIFHKDYTGKPRLKELFYLDINASINSPFSFVLFHCSLLFISFLPFFPIEYSHWQLKPDVSK